MLPNRKDESLPPAWQVAWISKVDLTVHVSPDWNRTVKGYFPETYSLEMLCFSMFAVAHKTPRRENRPFALALTDSNHHTAMSTKIRFILFSLLFAALLAVMFLGGCSNFSSPVKVPYPYLMTARLALPFVAAAALVKTIIEYFGIFKIKSIAGPPRISAMNFYILIGALTAYVSLLLLLLNKYCS